MDIKVTKRMNLFKLFLTIDIIYNVIMYLVLSVEYNFFFKLQKNLLLKSYFLT